MVEDFLRRAKNAFLGSNDEQVDQDAEYYSDREVYSASQDPYGDPADQDYYSNAIPASQDPYGDPGNYYGNAIPASQDPYGDPADEEYYGDIRPASEDPYGDPADEGYR